MKVKKVVGFLAAMVTAMAVFAFAPAAAYATDGEGASFEAPMMTEGQSDEYVDDANSGDSDEAVLPEGDAAEDDDAEPDVPADVPQDDDAPLKSEESDDTAEGDEKSQDEFSAQEDVVRVTAEAPTKVVEPCRPPAAPEQRWVKIAPTEGVQFFVNGELVDPSAGLIPVYSHEAAVTAVALEGFVLEGESEWFIPFDYKECPSDIVIMLPKTPEIIPCMYGCEPPYDMVFNFPLGVEEMSDDTQDLPEVVTANLSDGATASHPAQLAVTGGGDTVMNLMWALGAMLGGLGLASLFFGLPNRIRSRSRKEE